MPFTGNTFYLIADLSDQGSNNGSWTTTAPTNGAIAVADFGTSGGTKTIQWKFRAATSNTSVTPSNLATEGCNVKNADLDHTDGVTWRYVPADDWTVAGAFTVSQADVGGTASVLVYLALLRPGTGELVPLGNGSQTGISVTTAGSKAFSVTVPCVAAYCPQNFTLQVTMFTTGRSVAVTGQTYQLRRLTAGINPLTITLPSTGLRYYYVPDVESAAVVYLAARGGFVMEKVTQSAAVVYTAAYGRTLDFYRSASASVVYTASVTKDTVKAAVSASVVYTANALVQMSQTVLERISGSGVARRIRGLFDDL